MKIDRSPLVYAAAAGALAGICWLPFGLAPAMPVAMFVAMRGLRKVGTPREAARYGLVFAAARYAVASHFLLSLLAYSPLAIAFYLLAILWILPWGFLECWGAFRLEARGGLPRSIGFGLIYALGEWARTIGDLSFPADLLAHAFGTSPRWLGLSGVIGPFGLTLLIFGVAALADLAAEARRPKARGALLAAAVAAWLLPVAVDSAADRDGIARPAPLRVAVVQPDIDVRDKLDRARWPALWERLRELTRGAAHDVDLVVWPETARPGPVIWKEPEPFRDREMEALAAEVGVPILYGCEIARLAEGGSARIYNGAALARPDGGGGAWYGKQQLLPFAEGIPFARAFGWDPAKRARGKNGRESILTLLGNFSPGEGPTIFDAGKARVGVLVCFEGMYPRLSRQYRAAGADVLVVMTNDSWWGRSVFPRWHASMVAARARECDLPVVRAANGGVSSLTDRRGRTVAGTPLGVRTTLRMEVVPGSPAPPSYSARGDILVWGSLLLLGCAAAVGPRERRELAAALGRMQPKSWIEPLRRW